MPLVNRQKGFRSAMTVTANVTRESLEPSRPELLTMEDVTRIVTQRIRWYGLDHFAVQSIERLADHRIEAKIVDLAANLSYRRIFDIHPIMGSSSTSATAIAA